MRIMKRQTFAIALAAMALLGGCASSRQQASQQVSYDARPENKKPILVHKASPNYSIEDDKTFAAYKHPYTVARPEGMHLVGSRGTYALYRCKDATYLTISYRCPENAWFFHFNSEYAIVDNKTGDRYMLREVEHYPTDTCFWIKGEAGKNVCFVLKFPPLPLSVEEIDLFSPSSPSRYNFDGSAWRASGVRVEDLRPKNRVPQGEIIY